MQPLLDAIVAYVPSPAERDFAAVDAEGEEAAPPGDGSAPLAAFVWKTVADPFAGRITLFRVLSGYAQVRFVGAERHPGRRRNASAT